MKKEAGKSHRNMALGILRWFCPENLVEGIEGDLLEQFEKDRREVGEEAANRRVVWGAMRFFRPGIILRNSFTYAVIHTAMLSNYLVIAYRNVLKNKVFSAINIFGLGTGLAACLLIFQFVSFELSYDKFNEKFDRIYRVTNDRFQNGKLIQHGTITYPTIGPTMAKDFEEVEVYTRLMPGGDMNIKSEDRIFRGDNCYFVDEHFLSVFTFPLRSGQKQTALKEPYTIVLPEHTAKKYFRISDDDYSVVVGKVVYWGLDPQPYTIKGVCVDAPPNSHIQFDALVSYATLIRPDNHSADDSWTLSDMRHYLVLKPGADYKLLESKFDDFSDRYFQGDKVSGSVEKFYLQPLKDAHLYSNYEYDIAKRASGKAVWAMLIVAIFILVIAWINYINLTTSRAVERAKEVGLRKVMGALRAQLIKQFIFESMLIGSLAFIVAFLLALLVQSSFNEIIGNQLSLFSIVSKADTFTILVVFVVLAGGIFLSGFYPAFILSSYTPVKVLKGKFQRSMSGGLLRKALVIFQFATSAALVTSTIIVSRQLKFVNETELGINLQRTLIVRSPERTAWDSTFINRVERFKHGLSESSNVISVTTSGRLPGQRLGRTFDIQLKQQSASEHYTMSRFPVDHDFFDTYDIPLLAGRKFLPLDHNFDFEKINAVIFNKKATELLGFTNPSEIIGQQISFWGRDWNVIGVVGDFHQESLRNPMEPMFFYPVYGESADISIRLNTGNYEDMITSVKDAYDKYFPDNAFEYYFIEDNYKRQYQDDNRFGSVISLFTVIAIIISCLGLVGLSSYTAVQRTREIGIRKVLGASLYSIVSLLSLDFVKLVFVATMLSLPISYFAMQNWLSVYAYRITPGWLLFVIPVAIILLIAIVTLSFQVLKTAMTNPGETLKYE
jgi:putative ABC transport system permease protein